MRSIDRLNDLTQDDRRKRRRQRRIRSQIIAYSILVLAVAGLGIGAFFLIKNAAAYMEEYRRSVEEAIEPDIVETVAPEPAAEEPHTVESPVEETVEEEQPVIPTEDELLEEIVTTCIKEMPLEDKVAGLFMLTPEQLTGVDTAIKAGSGTQEALERYAVGGIVYYSKNIKSNEQITDMLNMTGAMSRYPLLLAVSENGSQPQVARILNVEAGDTAGAIGSGGDTAAAYENSSGIADYLLNFGFNLNLGISASLSGEDDSYGTDPDITGNMVAEAVQGCQNIGISASIGRFPADGNTASGMTTIELSDEELSAAKKVYEAGIKAGTRFIQISNVSIPDISGDNVPASLSSAVIRDIVRNELGFSGVIITGALNDAAVTSYYTPEQAAMLALAAGADILYQPEDFVKAYEGLLNAVQEGTIPEERIDESLKRIYRVKYRDRVGEIGG